MTSEQLTNILKDLKQVKNDYQYSYDKVGEMDLLTQDYLHMLEIVLLSEDEMSKIATQLKNTRLERRKHKDNVELLKPLVNCLDKHSRMIKDLEQVLGQMRQIEEE
mgnify:CR=1 FL=1